MITTPRSQPNLDQVKTNQTFTKYTASQPSFWSPEKNRLSSIKL